METKVANETARRKSKKTAVAPRMAKCGKRNQPVNLMNRVYRRLIVFLLVFALIDVCRADSPRPLRLATTTSTENSGLLAALLPAFEKHYGAPVRVIAVGTGQALKLGERGDVDVVMVHARADEDKFVAAGYGVNRRDVMYNDFILVGPKEDPANVRGMRDVGEALAKISDAGVKFVSRGDESGTHIMERNLWQLMGIKPDDLGSVGGKGGKGGKWYLSAGQGMGAVLTMAASVGAYTLTDRGTFVAYKSKIALDILVTGDPRLANPYGIIAVNPRRHADVNASGADALIEWITSTQGRQRINGFRANGEQLFFFGVPPAAVFKALR